MRLIFLILCSLVVTAQAGVGQIYAVTLNSEKANKKYQKYLVPLGAGKVILGEIKSGVTIDKRGVLNYPRNQRSEWFIGDSNNPKSSPYRVKNGVRGKVQRRQVLALPNSIIASISTFSDHESFYSLSIEFERREASLKELQKSRNALDPSSGEYGFAHGRVKGSFHQLLTWLGTYGFEGAKLKWAKLFEKDAKAVAKKSTIARTERAENSLVEASVEEELSKLAAGFVKGHVFKVQRSQHFRIRYWDDIQDGEVTQLLNFAEQVLEQFRMDFVDPYLAEDFPDRIPDHLFLEWHFGPNEIKLHEDLLESFYGHGWGIHKEETLKLSGIRRHLAGLKPSFLYYWRIRKDSDLFGIVAHNMGHILAWHHYGAGKNTVSQDWLSEALGYYISLQFRGVNTVTCKKFELPKENHTVASGGKEDQKKTVGREVVLQGSRQVYTSAGLLSGSPFQALVLLDLIDMKNGDLGKSWSLFDFLATQTGEAGQRFLRALGKYSGDKGAFARKSREHGELLFDSQGRDVFKVLDQRWREWARTQIGMD